MNDVTSISPGRVVAGPGAILADIDRATRAHSGQELRLHPSTYNTASIGGFIAGGSGGVGSINFGGLRDFGNVLRLRVVTMEAEPRVLDLTGEDLHKVTHAYGTNGIITEVEMPLTASYDWVDVIVGFDELHGRGALRQRARLPGRHPDQADHADRRARAASSISSATRSSCAKARASASSWSRRIRSTRSSPSRAAPAARSSTMPRPPPTRRRRACRRPIELAWNHTTLRALRVDPSITYLQSLYPFPDQLALVEKIDGLFPRRGLFASRIRALRRQHHLLRPAARALHHRGAAGRDHPPPRGEWLPDLQPAPLHAGGGRHEADRRGPARLQARGRSARACSIPAR